MKILRIVSLVALILGVTFFDMFPAKDNPNAIVVILTIVGCLILGFSVPQFARGYMWWMKGKIQEKSSKKDRYRICVFVGILFLYAGLGAVIGAVFSGHFINVYALGILSTGAGALIGSRYVIIRERKR